MEPSNRVGVDRLADVYEGRHATHPARRRYDDLVVLDSLQRHVPKYQAAEPASETIEGHYYSSSGGQNDFARGAMNSEGGQGFVVLHSTASNGASRIVPRLAAGDAVTTPKNTVDKVVTEYGVAELRGRSIRERTRALIDVAHPDHRAELTDEAQQMHYL